ncbi:terminase small subunit [Serratia sp. Lou2A]|uniref:Terminase small subunit n=1 Tax=Serratia montpellierensis TaxID=2598730 RepID=A0ABS8J7E9_9GAMM|nr:MULTISPECIES: terminase small subunit [unclassified Serratia (in: enterobacteria)]MCC7586239.1 terminase small subunit [Serratia sp. Lou2A]MCC7659945.1 terminase small subunit [Serratia sp. Pon4B]
MSQPEESGIERDYCAGQLSLREMAKIYGISEAAIRKRAKKHGWVRSEKTGTQVRKKGTQKAKVRTEEKMQNSTPEKVIEELHCDAVEGEDEFSIDSRKYGLSDMQWRFVNEYLIDLNRTAAYKRAGGKGEGNTAYVSASRIYRNAKVSRAINDALAARERRTQITQDEVLKLWWDIATADANQITEYRRLCCRHCWGFGFQYQWRDAVEYEEASEKAKTAKKPPPRDKGGYGFDSTLDPNPDCPRCNGAGEGRAHFHDTRDLKGAARRLFAGIKEGKFGIEVITRNQDDALKMVAQHLGMIKTKTELSGPDGGPVKTESVNMTTEEAAEFYRKMMG